jgi:hypothetical protein
MRPRDISAPKGRSEFLCRPFRAGKIIVRHSQGVALGWNISALRAEERLNLQRSRHTWA